MSRRIPVVVVVAVAVLAAGIVTDSAHGGSIPINWRFSGTIVNLNLAIPTATGVTVLPGLLIHAVVKGSPGNAQFTVVGIPHEPQLLAQCGGGPGQTGPGQTFSPNDMVITLDDLSMLFAELGPDGGWVCFQTDGTVTAVANMTIIGGTGKYQDASGEFIGKFKGYPVGMSGAFAAETGTIVGEIDR